MKFHHLNLNEKPNLGEDISILIEHVLNLQEDDKKYLTRLSITLSEIEPKINFAQIFKTVFFSKASLISLRPRIERRIYFPTARLFPE